MEKIYEGTLENIEGSYKIINTALSDKKNLTDSLEIISVVR